MSGLTDLLTGRVPPGVHLWPSSAEAGEIARTVAAAGWRFVHLDGAGVDDRAAFLTRIGEVLEFPATYGVNFDALADLLDDVGDGDADGTLLLWDAWEGFATDERWFPVARAVLAERAAAEHLPPFVVLLRQGSEDPLGGGFGE